MKIGRERQRAGEDEALTWREAPALPRPESSGHVFDRGLRVLASSGTRTDESVRGKRGRSRHVTARPDRFS